MKSQRQETQATPPKAHTEVKRVLCILRDLLTGKITLNDVVFEDQLFVLYTLRLMTQERAGKAVQI